MNLENNTDNVCKVGSHIFAKESPRAELVITKYYQRIYYCTRLKDEKELVYFERELILI